MLQTLLFKKPITILMLLSAFIHDNLEHFSVLSAKKGRRVERRGLARQKRVECARKIFFLERAFVPRLCANFLSPLVVFAGSVVVGV